MPETCKICWEREPANNLITPCACTGSMKFVHKTCLTNWLFLKENCVCEVCKSVIQFTLPLHGDIQLVLACACLYVCTILLVPCVYFKYHWEVWG